MKTNWTAFMSDPQYLAQIGHSLGALSVVLFATLFWGATGAYVAVIIGTMVAALKEFVFDLAVEIPKQSWADSGMDFGFYMLGATIGLIIMAIWHYGLKRG